jgi:hypothetical protein
MHAILRSRDHLPDGVEGEGIGIIEIDRHGFAP